MKDTAAQSAELKMALKRDQETPELAREAMLFPAEADEAIADVEKGYDEAASGSWVEGQLS